MQASEEEDAAELAEEQESQQMEEEDQELAEETASNVNEDNLNDIINQAIQQNMDQENNDEEIQQEIANVESEQNTEGSTNAPRQLSSPGGITGLAGEAVGPGLPEMGSKLPYIVVKGDTLAKIAKQIYGNYKKWKDLANLSKIETPNLIYPGDIVYYQLTEQTTEFAKMYENKPKTEVVVKEGDTLASISRDFYGQKEYWKLIWRQNSKIKNPDVIVVGSVLYLSPLKFSKPIGAFSKVSHEGQPLTAKSRKHDVKNTKV